MTVEYPDHHYVHFDFDGETACIHEERCPAVVKAVRLRPTGDRWTGPCIGFEGAEQAAGARKVKLCGLCKPDPNPCDPDSFDVYIRGTRGGATRADA